MAQQKGIYHQPIKTGILGRRMLIGAAFGLVLITAFLFSVGEPNPAWPKLWMVRPLIIVPFAGALGGLFNYLLVHFHASIGVNKTVAVILSAVVFFVGLWLGTALGLDGTLWD